MFRNFSKGLVLACIIIALQIISFAAKAQLSRAFKGVKMYDPIEVVKEKMSKHCQKVWVVKADKPSFPLAKKQETHLICKTYHFSKKRLAFDLVAFTFADGKLSQIEAKGKFAKRLAFNEYYKGYKFFGNPDMMIVNEAKETVWFLSKEGQHPNLFAWSNPYLASEPKKNRLYRASAKTPAMFKFGQGVEALKPVFEKNTTFMNVQKYGEGKAQINCFGVEYAGFPRKIEAMFRDDKLYRLWILTAKAEEDRIRKALIKAYGKPVFTNKKWEVYNHWKVSLRKDKPEVMVLSEAWAVKHKKGLLKQK